MEGYLPSEKARLVLGYLKEVGSLNTFKTFLSECPYLAEYASLYRRGHEYPLHIGGQTLSQILDDYAKIKSKGCRIPEPVAGIWQSFESICHELKMCYIPQMRLPVMGQSHRSRRGSMIQSLKNSFALSGNTHDSKTKNNDGDCKRSISDSAIRNDTNETEPNANLHEQDNLCDSTKMAASQVLEDKQPVHILPVNLSTLRDAGIQVITQEGINKQLSKNMKQRHLGVQFSSSSPNSLNQSHSQLHDMTASDNCFETEVLGHEEKAQSEHCISSTKIRTSDSCSNNETLSVKIEPQGQKREELKSVELVIDSSDRQNPLVGFRDNQQSAINDDFDILQTPKKLEIAVEEKCIGKSPKRKCLQPKRRSIREESPAKLSSSSTADRTFNVPAITKGDPPNLKEKETYGQVASENSLEFCNAEDVLDIPHVLEQLLSNTEIHQKLAENINKVKYKGQDAPPTPQTPAPDVLDDFLVMPEADLPSEAITDVIEMTKHDPVFDSLFKLFSIDKNDFLEKEYGPNFAQKPKASFHENQQGTEGQSQQSTKAHETLASGEKGSELQQQTQQHVINTQPTEKTSSDLPTTPSRNARRAQSLNKKTANKGRSKGRPTRRAASKFPVLLPAPPVQSRTFPDMSRFRNIAPKCTSEMASGVFNCVVVSIPSKDTLTKSFSSIQSVEPATKASSMAAVAFSSTASPLCLDSKQVTPNTAAVSVPGADHSSTMVRSSTAAASVPPAGHSTPRKEAEKPSTKWSPGLKALINMASPGKPIIEISVEKNQGLKPSISRSKSSKPSVPLNVDYVPDGLLSTKLLKDNNSDSSPTASLLQSSDKSSEQQQEISGICSGPHTNSTFQTISPGAILLTPSSDSTAHSHLGYFHSPCPAAQGGMVEGNNMSKRTITKHVRVLSFKKNSKVSKPVTAKSKAALPTDRGVICDKKQRRRAPKTYKNVETNFSVGKQPIETINVFQERKLPSLHPKKNLNSKKETVRDLLRAKMEGKKIAQGNNVNQVAMPSAENAQQVILSDLVCPPQSKDLLTQKTNGIDLTFVEKSDLGPVSDALAAPALKQHPSVPAFSRQTWATVFGENSNQAYQPYPCIEKAKPDCTEKRRLNKHIHKHKHKNINHKRSCSKYSTKKYKSGQVPVSSFSASSVSDKVESNPPTQGDMCTAISPQPILQTDLTSPALILPTATSSQTAPHIINDDVAGNNQLLPCSDSSATIKFVPQELHKSEMTAAMFTSVKDNKEHSTVEPTSKLTPVPSKTIQDSNESEVAETLVCLATRLPDLENTTASLQMAAGGRKVDSSQEMKPRGQKRRERGKCDEPRAKKSKLKKLSKMDVDKFLSKLHG